MENKTVFYYLPFYGAIIVQIYLFFVNSFDCEFRWILLDFNFQHICLLFPMVLFVMGIQSQMSKQWYIFFEELLQLVWLLEATKLIISEQSGRREGDN